MSALRYKVGSVRPWPVITFTREDENGDSQVEDLSGASSITAKCKLEDTDTILAEKTMVAVDAVNGQFRIEWDGDDISVAGEWVVEFTIEWDSASPELSPVDFAFTVVEAF